jgi:hypothetical protein
MSTILEQYIRSVIENELLSESKQSLMKLGLPEIIASLISEKFGKNDFIVANWYKDQSGYKFKEVTWTPDHKRVESEHPNYPSDWWVKANDEWSSRGGLSVVDLVNIFQAAQEDPTGEKYRKLMDEKGYSPSEDWDQQKTLKMLRGSLSDKLFNQTFFSYNVMIQDIESGKLTDLKPYKDLSFAAAQDKYDQRRTVKDPTKIIKTYPNGWKWINAGAKCQLLGKQMKNCGSTGVMSGDEERTILALYDKVNNPHVMVTYSPNEKRISGDQGQGSKMVKDKYHDYVIDLANTLGVRFDYEKSDSKMLKIKAALHGQIQGIERVAEDGSAFDEYFKVVMNDNSVWYTDAYSFIPEQDVINNGGGDIGTGVKNLFGRQYRAGEAPQVTRVDFHAFINGARTAPPPKKSIWDY